MIDQDKFDRLKRHADERNARYPQYAGYHDGPEWGLVTIKREVTTKMGRAFIRGEVALGRLDQHEGFEGYYEIWSVSNGVHTCVGPHEVHAFDMK